MPKGLAQSTLCLTGYSGYFGSHVLGALLHAGIRPFLIGRPSARPAKVEGAVMAERWTSPAELAEQVARLKNPIVINIAGLIASDHRPEDIPRLVSANFEYPVQILETVALAGNASVINIGTTREFSGASDPNPVNLYGQLKAANAATLAWYAGKHRFRAINLKVTDSYRGLDDRAALVPYLRRCARTGVRAELRFSAQRLNLAHMIDVVEGILASAASCAEIEPGQARTQVLLGPETTTIGALIDILQKDVVPGFEASFADNRRDVSGLADIWEDAPGIPGWQPRVALLDGLGMFFRDASGCGNSASASGHLQQ